MRRIYIINDMNGERVGSLSPVGGDPYWGSICDLIAEHFHCDPDDVGSIEPDEDDEGMPLEYLTIDDTKVATLELVWRP